MTTTYNNITTIRNAATAIRNVAMARCDEADRLIQLCEATLTVRPDTVEAIAENLAELLTILCRR